MPAGREEPGTRGRGELPPDREERIDQLDGAVRA